MMKTKWRCRECGKLLSSKQTALKHIDIFHKTVDPSEGESVTKVKVQVKEKEYKEGNQNIENPSTTKKAFGFFAPLTNIFNNDSLVEGFSWGEKKKAPDKNDNAVVSTSQGQGLDSILNISNQDELNFDFSTSEAIIAAADSEETTFDILFPSSKKSTARPTFVPPILQVCDIPKTALDKTINDLDIESPALSPQSLEVECDLPGVRDDPGCSTPPTHLPYHTTDIILSPTSLTVPVKTRGHCGKDDCVGCNTQPCGVCYRCLNKRKIR